MKLIWKLLRQHVSLGQLAGFFFANLFGMMIVLLSVQFYRDIVPMFSGKDSFIKSDFIVLTKRVSTLGSLSGSGNLFSHEEIDEVEKQSFAKHVGVFTPSCYDVNASLGMGGEGSDGMHFSTEMFFESVPDAFVDVAGNSWRFTPGQKEIPIILPKNYINLYNFGFAQSRSLPKISEGLMGMIALDIRLRGQGKEERFKGRIVGFSTRLNTILVPQTFNDWANSEFGEKRPSAARLIVEVDNPADDGIAKFIQKKGYETEDDKLEAGRMTYFLKLVTGIVLLIGLVISVLSFYILMLSIYLLLQKNTTKLENLLLIGYSPGRVALPYQCLTLGLNACVLLIALLLVAYARALYMGVVTQLFPQMEEGTLWVVVLIGIAIFVGVSVVNCIAVRRKVNSIWIHKA